MSSPISGFTAIPNPQMLAFMPIQSYLMMYFAGAGWQIGKRKISAIPNDKFNAMSSKDLLEGFTADLRATIPTLEKSLQDVSPLIRVLVEQYGDFIREAIAAAPQAVANIFGGGASNTGGREVVARTSTGIPKGLASASLGYAQQQLMQQYILEQQARAGSQQNIRTSQLNPAQRMAIERQRLYEEEQRRIRRIRADTVAKGLIKPVLPQVRQNITQHAAGQSARRERVRLIRAIAQAGQGVKLNTGSRRLNYIEQLKNHQQKLVNLLARYRF